MCAEDVPQGSVHPRSMKGGRFSGLQLFSGPHCPGLCVCSPLSGPSTSFGVSYSAPSRAPEPPLHSSAAGGALLPVKPLRLTTDRETAVCPVTGPSARPLGRGGQVERMGKETTLIPSAKEQPGRGGTGATGGVPALPILTLVCPNLYCSRSTSMELRSFSEAFLLSMNCPSGMALALRIRYLRREDAGQVPAQSPSQPRPARPGPPLSCGYCWNGRVVSTVPGRQTPERR